MKSENHTTELRPFYRRVEEIDLLRALAILSVLSSHLFHLVGGFIGVDIFFVISGYVITLLLMKELARGQFRFSQFFHHRIARIIPPLFIVSIFIFVCTRIYFWIPEDEAFIRNSFKFQAFFAQNFFFAAQSADYFHGLTSAKLNLHFWSLAVEEQFYIIYPFLFWIAYRWKNKKWLQISIVIFFIASFAITIPPLFERYLAPLIDKLLRINSDNDSAHRLRYYLLPTRLWELLSGTMACLTAALFHKRIKERGHPLPIPLVQSLAIASFLSIIVPMPFLLETYRWPHPFSIVPVASTMFLLVAFHLYGADLAPTLSSNRPLLIIGRASYSLYLWHWSLLAVLIYICRDFGNLKWDMPAYLAVLAILSSASYLLLEKNRHRISKVGSLTLLISFMSFSWVAGHISHQEKNRPFEIQQILQTGTWPDPCKMCTNVVEPKGPFFVLWGDSHSQTVSLEIEQAGINKGLLMVHLAGVTLDQEHTILKKLLASRNFRGLIAISRWQMYAAGFPSDEPEETMNWCRLKINGKKSETPAEMESAFRFHLKRLITMLPINKPAYFMLEVPRYPFFPRKEAVIDWTGHRLRPLPVKTIEQHRHDQKLTREIFTEVSKNNRSMQIIDTTPIFCPDGLCRWRDGFNLFYFDDDHLSGYGANRLRPQFDRIMAELKSKG